ncbi:MAG TPA: hypothetical protein VLC09_19620 [Polyangiaceae bacterium]|nr:hypothetical protein [Polyangiaceae bacterium]
MSANLTIDASPHPISAALESTAPGVLARGTYDELRGHGLSDVDIMAFAGELLALVATGVREDIQS